MLDTEAQRVYTAPDYFTDTGENALPEDLFTNRPPNADQAAILDAVAVD